MKINIFGVGRSGTKAIVNSSLYLLASNYNNVRLNYEPYFWINTKGVKSFRGMKHAYFDSQSFNPIKLENKQERFIRSLGKGNLPTISKFIRANHKINAINDILSPDISIIVIRDLYEVLASVMKFSWDFFRIGYNIFELSHRTILFNLINEAYESELITKGQQEEFLEMSKINDYKRFYGNAIYWYLMNKTALVHTDSKNSFYQYDSGSVYLGEIMQEIKYKGNLANYDSEIIKMSGLSAISSDLYDRVPIGIQSKPLSLIDQYSYLAFQKLLRRPPLFAINKCGENYNLNKNTNSHSLSETEYKPMIRVSISRNSFLNSLNNEILDLLKDKILL